MIILEQCYINCILTGFSCIRNTNEGVKAVELREIYDYINSKTKKEILKELENVINQKEKYEKLRKYSP